MVPGLTLGNKNLKVTVNDVPVVEFLEIVDTPATPVVTSNDPADVFADLIEDGVLVAFWGYNNDDEKWRVYEPGLSDTESAALAAAGVLLTEVNPGDAGWINLSADATFQGTRTARRAGTSSPYSRLGSQARVRRGAAAGRPRHSTQEKVTK